MRPTSPRSRRQCCRRYCWHCYCYRRRRRRCCCWLLLALLLLLLLALLLQLPMLLMLLPGLSGTPGVERERRAV